jgi:hypothetical protein
MVSSRSGRYCDGVTQSPLQLRLQGIEEAGVEGADVQRAGETLRTSPWGVQACKNHGV